MGKMKQLFMDQQEFEENFDYDQVAYQESLWFSSDAYLKARRRQQSDSMVTMTQIDHQGLRQAIRDIRIKLDLIETKYLI